MLTQLESNGRRLLHLLDRVNDRLTSYRLVLYSLLAMLAWALVGAGLDKVSYSAGTIVLSAVWIIGICWLSNRLISRFLNIPINRESDLITGLILTLILAPATTGAGLAVSTAAALAAMASKFVITYQKAHIFNPAAIGAMLAGAVFHHYPAWWVGTKFITPVVVICGLLILRKMNRFTTFGVFLAFFVLYLIYGTSSGSNLHGLWLEIVSTQVLFFGIIMLTEPQTSPTPLNASIVYALVVGMFYTVTKFKLSPEEALLAGNLLTFIIARNRRYQLTFARSVQEAEGIYSYFFSKPKDFRFLAGQYMEWTVARHKSDSRGNRRYLTITSAPEDNELVFTVKVPPQPSAFKQSLQRLKPGDKLLAARVAGSFTMPADPAQKVAFLAGGVGITPFHSMIRHTEASKDSRDITLVYSVAKESEFAYRQLFDKLDKDNIRVIYSTDRLDGTKLKQAVNDYKERKFYVSGPLPFVAAMQAQLAQLGVASSQIATDYFPGYGG